MLVIDPDECIDCNLCVPECPVDAILAEDDLSEEQLQFIDLNEKYSREWPTITVKKDAPEDAEQWRGVENKMEYFESGE